MSRMLAITTAVLFEAPAAYMFFAQQGNLKRKRQTSFAIGTALFLSSPIIYSLFPTVACLNGLYFIIINFLFAVSVFDIRRDRALFGAAVLGLLSAALDFAVLSVFSYFTARGDIQTPLHADNTVCCIVLTLIRKLLYFLCSLLLARWIQREKTRRRISKIYCIYPFAAIGVLLLMRHLYISAEIPNDGLLFFPFICVFLLLSVMLLFTAYRSAAEKENTVRALQNQADKNETEKQYYSVMEKQNENLRMYAHDTKKHLNVIRALNKDPQIDAYLSQMTDCLREYRQISGSGNRILDILCSKYAAECESRHIGLHLDFRSASFTYVADFDLVTVFGNLLDNAVEAAANSQRKEIFVRTSQKNNCDICIVENSCDTPPKAHGRELKTTKFGREPHGLGLKNMTKALQKYGGDYDWNYDTAYKQFCITVMFPAPQEPQG